MPFDARTHIIDVFKFIAKYYGAPVSEASKYRLTPASVGRSAIIMTELDKLNTWART